MSKTRTDDLHEHYVIRCSCGIAIEMCWCGSTKNREEIIVEDGCAKCSRMNKVSNERTTGHDDDSFGDGDN